MSAITEREYFERILAEREKHFNQRFVDQAIALKLQAEKDQRHFESLNHEQARLLADRERYLPRETYAADRKDKAAIWLAVASLAVAILTLFVMIQRTYI